MTKSIKPIDLFFPVALTILLGAVGCGTHVRNMEDNAHSIVLIVDSVSFDRFFTYLSGSTFFKNDSVFMSYVDDDGKLTDIYLPRGRRDTIAIWSKRKYIEFESHPTMATRYVLLAGGDTVFVSFNALKEPLFHSLRDERLSDLYNFYTALPLRRFHYNLFAPESAGSMPLRVAMDMKERMPSDEFDRSAIRFEYIPRDTLQRALDDFFRTYTEKMNTIDADPEYKAWLAYRLALQKNALAPTPMDSLISDFYAPYISYHTFLSDYANRVYRPSKRIPFGASANGVYAEPMGHRGHRMLFDTLRYDSTLPPRTKMILMKYAVDLMQKERYPDYEEVKDIYTDLNGGKNIFREDAPDCRQIDYTSMELVDDKGHQLTFETLLQKHAGNIIFVDFWATTCGPCLASMPAAEQLRGELAGEGVVFLYISTWDTVDIWKKEWRKTIGDDLNYESYLVTNYEQSKMFRALNISSIPRYILFDRQGILIDDNAPGPQSPNLYGYILSLASPR